MVKTIAATYSTLRDRAVSVTVGRVPTHLGATLEQERPREEHNPYDRKELLAGEP